MIWYGSGKNGRPVLNGCLAGSVEWRKMYARCLTAIVLTLTQIFPTRIEATKYYRSNAACWNGGDGEPSCRDYCLQVPHLTTFTCRERITTGRLPIRGGKWYCICLWLQVHPDRRDETVHQSTWQVEVETINFWRRTLPNIIENKRVRIGYVCIEFDFSPHRSQ